MSKSRRALFSTWDGAGNIPPVQTLVRGLVAQGVEVHILGHETTRERFRREGATFHPLQSVPPTEYVNAGLPGAEEYACAVEDVFYQRGYQTDLHAAIKAVSPDVVLVDASLRYGLLEGLRSGIPMVVLCHTLYGSMMGGGDETGDPYFQQLNEVAVQAGLTPFRSRRHMADTASLSLVYSYAPFDSLSGREAGPNVLHVGPLRSPNHAPANWSRNYPERPLALVSLSTSYMYQQEQVVQHLCDACAALDVEALVTTGPTHSPDTLDMADNVTAVEFIPHDALLPDTDLLVNHAGHGTVMAGVTHGVPMLCLPMGRDQPDVADQVAILGLGAVLEADASVEALRQTISDMLSDRQLSETSSAFAHSLETHPGLEEAIAAIRGVIKFA